MIDRDGFATNPERRKDNDVDCNSLRNVAFVAGFIKNDENDRIEVSIFTFPMALLLLVNGAQSILLHLASSRRE